MRPIEPREKSSGEACVVCGHEILERSVIPYIPYEGAGLYGPGSRSIATEKDRRVTGYHCPVCGIEYHHLPRPVAQK
ncbi:hypothetical protein [Thioalkalivibrio thiocyanodenitrificans]|uniref:hypothetical protein n=1 Tax=Thioalkalivibrio thiocyanodenitrificans TaxID=243063 RepID=UPI0012EA2CC6|nr:hypothetical protein [Thioalkalivibrio thiocyanodenitrificans]